MPCGFESHLSHQKIRVPLRAFGFFIAQMGLESPAWAKRRYKTVQWTVLLGVGESLEFETHQNWMWIKFKHVRCRKSVGTTYFFEKSYKNTRTKKEAALWGGLFFGMWGGTRMTKSQHPSGMLQPPVQKLVASIL